MLVGCLEFPRKNFSQFILFNIWERARIEKARPISGLKTLLSFLVRSHARRLASRSDGSPRPVRRPPWLFLCFRGLSPVVSCSCALHEVIFSFFAQRNFFTALSMREEKVRFSVTKCGIDFKFSTLERKITRQTCFFFSLCWFLCFALLSNPIKRKMEGISCVNSFFSAAILSL